MCLLVVCRGLEAVWWVVLGVYVDVHGEWVILLLWVAANCNILGILSLVGMVCLACVWKMWSPLAVLGLYSMYAILSAWYVGV